MNPARGYIVTANNHHGSSHAVFNSKNPSTARATRLEQIFSNLVSQGHKFDLEDMKKIQSDVEDVYANSIRRAFKIIARTHLSDYNMNTPEITQVLDLMHEWKSSDFTLDSVEASIYSMWHMIFFGKFFVKTIPEEEVRMKLFEFYEFDNFIINTIHKLNHDPSYFSEHCELPGESNIKNACVRNLLVSLKEALQFLKAQFGED
jgi:penicillin G amidase